MKSLVRPNVQKTLQVQSKKINQPSKKSSHYTYRPMSCGNLQVRWTRKRASPWVLWRLQRTTRAWRAHKSFPRQWKWINRQLPRSNDSYLQLRTRARSSRRRTGTISTSGRFNQFSQQQLAESIRCRSWRMVARPRHECKATCESKRTLLRWQCILKLQVWRWKQRSLSILQRLRLQASPSRKGDRATMRWRNRPK